MTNKKIASEIAVGIILLIAVVVGGIFWMQSRSAVTNNPEPATGKVEMQKPVEEKGVFCTQEAKSCDDGKTYVFRTGPKCEFAQCPAVDETANWQTYKNEEYGFEIKLTDAWTGYRVVKKDGYLGSKLLYFEVPTNSLKWEGGRGFAAPFSLDIYTIRGWEAQQAEDGPKPTFIAKNDRYVFTFGRWQDVPEDLRDKNFDFEKVIATFKFTK